MTVPTFIGGLGLIYKNFYTGRPKDAVLLMTFMQVTCTLMACFGHGPIFGFVPVYIWWIVLPSAIYLIDHRRMP